METLEDAQQVGKRSTKPIHGPGGHHIELSRVYCLHHGVKPRALIPALRATYSGILENLDALPAGSLCHRLKLPALIVGVLLRGADPDIDRDALHGFALREQSH